MQNIYGENHKILMKDFAENPISGDIYHGHDEESSKCQFISNRNTETLHKL